MNRRFKYLCKNMGVLTASNFASKILVFLLVPIYTSALSTTEYGVFDLTVTTITLFYPLLTLNIVDAVMRFSMDKTYSQDEVVSVGVKYVSLSFAIVVLFMFFIHKVHFLADIAGYELLISLYYIFYVLNQFFIQLSKGLV